MEPVNLLKRKIKKIVAEHGYLKKSDLTEFELAQLDNKPHMGKLVDIWDDFLKNGPHYPGLPPDGKQS